jgi:hypothetical protein
MKLNLTVSVNVPKRVIDEEPMWQDVVAEQITEAIPEEVYYNDEDGKEYEFKAEATEWEWVE